MKNERVENEDQMGMIERNPIENYKTAMEKKNETEQNMARRNSRFSSNRHDDELELSDIPMFRRVDNISQEKLDRMRYRQNKKPFLFYPEDQYKIYWDLFITVILLASCIITPWRIAFSDIK